MKLSDPIFDQMVQLNVRIPLRTKARLEAHIEYLEDDSIPKPDETIDWPHSLAGIVREALDDYLASRPNLQKKGQEKGTPRPPEHKSKIKRKSKIKPRSSGSAKIP